MMYTCTGLTKAFGSKRVLDIPHLELPLGKTTMIMGPNGAGKSTLLRILAMLDLDYQGTLQIGDQKVARSSEVAQQFYRRSAFIWQRPVMFNMSVAANVGLGLRLRGVDSATIKERVDKALERLGITELAQANAKRLSGGEMQKVSIARALVVEPEFLFIDEPSSNLDVDSIDLMHRLILEEKAAGKTIFLITHNFAEGQSLADYAVFLNRGSVVAAGPLSELAANQSLQENAIWRYL